MRRTEPRSRAARTSACANPLHLGSFVWLFVGRQIKRSIGSALQFAASGWQRRACCRNPSSINAWANSRFRFSRWLYARRCSSCCSVSFMALNGGGHVSHKLGGEQSRRRIKNTSAEYPTASTTNSASILIFARYCSHYRVVVAVADNGFVQAHR